MRQERTSTNRQETDFQLCNLGQGASAFRLEKHLATFDPLRTLFCEAIIADVISRYLVPQPVCILDRRAAGSRQA
jgi:hypothetical protein